MKNDLDPSILKVKVTFCESTPMMEECIISHKFHKHIYFFPVFSKFQSIRFMCTDDVPNKVSFLCADSTQF